MAYPRLRVWLVAIVAYSCIGTVGGCAPPPLTNQPRPDTSTPADANNDDAGVPDSDTGEVDAGPPPDFTEIAAILRYRCAESGCHAGDGQQGFGIQNGPIATEQQIRDALEGNAVEGEQTKLVEPGMPTESAIYQVLIPLEGRTPMPWMRPKLPPEEITAIERWIRAGANYD